MPSSNVSEPNGAPASFVDVAIIGGGVCGLLAAQQCTKQGMSYRIVERESEFGGNWLTLANEYSRLQAYEPLYRWDDRYRLSSNLFSRNKGSVVLSKLQEFARDLDCSSRTWFGSEAVTVQQLGPGQAAAGRSSKARQAAEEDHGDLRIRSQGGRPCHPGSARPPAPPARAEADGARAAVDRTPHFRVACRDVGSGASREFASSFLVVTAGLLGEQRTAAERGARGQEAFQGLVTLAGRHRGRDCALGSADSARGKRVVVLGSGAFAAEAAEQAAAAGAAHVTVVSRTRRRWFFPFCRQFTFLWLGLVPLLPWRWKMAVARGYSRLAFYRPCGMEHWCPEGSPGEMDYSGQNNDGLFELSFRRRATCIVGDVDCFESAGVVLKSGERLAADVVVVAAGCKTVLQPGFLKELDVGFHNVHNFAFLGPNPRIGCAADFVFGFVPAGPMAQLSMAFRSFALCRERGAEGEELVRRALEPTAMIPPGDGMQPKGGRMAGQHTWFQSRHWWSAYSWSVEERADVYARTMCLGRSRAALALFRAKLKAAIFGLWILCSVLALYELFRYPSFLFARRPPAGEPEEKLALDGRSAGLGRVKASRKKAVDG